jgi:hypothetical protein
MNGICGVIDVSDRTWLVAPMWSGLHLNGKPPSPACSDAYLNRQ